MITYKDKKKFIFLDFHQLNKNSTLLFYRPNGHVFVVFSIILHKNGVCAFCLLFFVLTGRFIIFTYNFPFILAVPIFLILFGVFNWISHFGRFEVLRLFYRRPIINPSCTKPMATKNQSGFINFSP